MRICLDCSEILRDADMTCTKCGSKNLSLIMDEKGNVTDNSVKRKKRFHLSKPAIIIIAVLLALCLIIGSVTGGLLYYYTNYLPSQPAIEGVRAVNEGHVQDYLNSLYYTMKTPVRESIEKAYGSIDEFDSTQKGLIAQYGDDVTVDVTVVDVQHMSAPMIYVFNETYSEDYSLEITDGYYITVKTCITGDTMMQTVTSTTVETVKIGDGWYYLEEFDTGSSSN